MHRDRCQRINGEGVRVSKGGNQQIELSELCHVSDQNNFFVNNAGYSPKKFGQNRGG